jgi:hypothetical protein
VSTKEGEKAHWLRVTPAPTANVPAWVRKCLNRGLSERPEDRYSTMDELLDALARGPTTGRHRVPAGVVGVVVAVVVIAIVRGVDKPPRSTVETHSVSAPTPIFSSKNASAPSPSRDRMGAARQFPSAQASASLPAESIPVPSREPKPSANAEPASVAAAPPRRTEESAAATPPTTPLQTKPPASSTPSLASASAPPVPTDADSPPSTANCDPPLFIDSNGIEHVKPGCL